MRKILFVTAAHRMKFLFLLFLWNGKMFFLSVAATGSEIIL
jgi:hypothetical protein